MTTNQKNAYESEQKFGSGAAVESDPRMTSLRDVKDDVSQLKNDVTDYASSAAHTGVEAVKAGAERVAETGRRAADVARESHGKMCEYVTANPTTSVLIAAGVGALLARFLPRR
ncbi:MAG: hypothetical protein KC983_04390 [Phycisphaerales bacterium]|nr:hypothetical protein [Phycisphaerales bacterium]